jgi:hypothetical protein
MFFLILSVLNVLLFEASLNNKQSLPSSTDHLQSLQEGGGGCCCKFCLGMDLVITGLHNFVLNIFEIIIKV